MPRTLSHSIEKHVIAWREEPWPLPWPSIFGREAPLVLEIGFGNGEFLSRSAAEDPDRDHVGLELSWSGATRLFKRLRDNETGNARALLIDAEVALQHLFGPNSIDEVHVIHPCPWPKARHVDRRILNAAGLNLLASRMRLGARLTVITDHAEYAAWLSEVLTSQQTLASCHATVEVAELPAHRPTKYQRKAMALGIPIHFFQWRKELPCAAREPLPTVPNTDMPSLNLRGYFDAEKFVTSFSPRVLRETHDGVEVTVKLHAVYRQVPRDGDQEPAALLVETLVQEDHLRQEFAILVAPRKESGLLIKLSGLGRPHPTHGVKRAVFCVGEWLRSAAPDLELVHENLGNAALAPAEPEIQLDASVCGSPEAE